MSSSRPGAKTINNTTRYGLLIFFSLTIVQLYAVAAGDEFLRFASKPLLMPLLATTVYFGSKLAEKKYIISGLCFAFLGDTFLLLESKQPLLFIPGLVAFLITHVCYILYFLRIRSTLRSPLKARPYILLLVIGYGAGLVSLLYPTLGSLRLPVIIYAITICTMLAASIETYRGAGDSRGLMYISGAILFVISDSLLAVNKFYEPFRMASFFIMLTYCAAQFFIVYGFLIQRRGYEGSNHN